MTCDPHMFRRFYPHSAERALIPLYCIVCWRRIHNMLLKWEREGLDILGGVMFCYNNGLFLLVSPRGRCKDCIRVVYWSALWKSWQNTTLQSMHIREYRMSWYCCTPRVWLALTYPSRSLCRHSFIHALMKQEGYTILHLAAMRNQAAMGA